MKFISLVSGGKDSIYNTILSVERGHELVAMLNLFSETEYDSYMYQNAGRELVHLLEQCVGVPLESRAIKGTARNTGIDYSETEQDEVEDMYQALLELKSKYSFEAVAVGAIGSTYQSARVHNVCRRLGLEVLAFLWGRNQKELLLEMLGRGMKCIVVKAGTLGMGPDSLGRDLAWVCHTYGKMVENMVGVHKGRLKEEDFNLCGEGGEYETFTLDCPMFAKRIEVTEAERVSACGAGHTGYLVAKSFRLLPK